MASVADHGAKRGSTRYAASCATSCGSSGTIDHCVNSCPQEQSTVTDRELKPEPPRSSECQIRLDAQPDASPAALVVPSNQGSVSCSEQQMQEVCGAHASEEVVCQDSMGPFPSPRVAVALNGAGRADARCVLMCSLFKLHGDLENLDLMISYVLTRNCIRQITC